jgi:putative membrane protein
MGPFLLHWAVVSVALWIAAYIVPGVIVSSWPALVAGALVLGFVNAVIRPIVPGFSVASFWAALFGALVVSLVSWFIGSFLTPPRTS